MHRTPSYDSRLLGATTTTATSSSTTHDHDNMRSFVNILAFITNYVMQSHPIHPDNPLDSSRSCIMCCAPGSWMPSDDTTSQREKRESAHRVNARHVSQVIQWLKITYLGIWYLVQIVGTSTRYPSTWYPVLDTRNKVLQLVHDP